MNNKVSKSIRLLSFGLVSFSLLAGASFVKVDNSQVNITPKMAVLPEPSNRATRGHETPGGVDLHLDAIHNDPNVQAYYASIGENLKGNELKNALDRLVSKNQCQTGYKALWDYYPYCDANPDNPNDGTITAYYRGTRSTRGAMNKEHVWPDSRGGHRIEGDPHMTRPTNTSDNSSRGNSFYVEGKHSGSSGWDPLADDMTEYYRGDCARIIMYCAVQEPTFFKLIDEENDSADNHTMGKLSDLIRWNYEYPVNKYEKFRNDVLSGFKTVKNRTYHFNRNPFIDDRDLACRIWGDYNGETQRLCSIYAPQVAPTKITLNATEIKLAHGNTYQLNVTSVAPADASKNVIWSSTNTNVVTVSAKGLATGNNDGSAQIIATSSLDKKVKATVDVVVKTEKVKMTDVTTNLSKITLDAGDSTQLTTTVVPSNTYPQPSITFESLNPEVVSVSNTGLVTGVKEGNGTIKITAHQVIGEEEVNIWDEIPVTINKAPEVTDFTIKFKTGGSSQISTDAALKDYIASGAQNVANFTGIAKLWQDPKGLKMGSGSGAGSFEINLADNVKNGIFKTIKFKACNYKSSEIAKLSINGIVSEDLETDSKEFVIDIPDGKLPKITITSVTHRVFLQEITLSTKGGTTPPEPPVPPVEEETAMTLANYLLAEDTEGQCVSKFPVAKGKYMSLSEVEQNKFKNATEGDLKLAKDRYEAWAKHLHENPYSNDPLPVKVNKVQRNSNVLIAVCVIAVVVINLLVAGSLYFILKGKKHN